MARAMKYTFLLLLSFFSLTFLRKLESTTIYCCTHAHACAEPCLFPQSSRKGQGASTRDPSLFFLHSLYALAASILTSYKNTEFLGAYSLIFVRAGWQVCVILVHHPYLWPFSICNLFVMSTGHSITDHGNYCQVHILIA